MRVHKWKTAMCLQTHGLWIIDDKILGGSHAEASSWCLSNVRRSRHSWIFSAALMCYQQGTPSHVWDGDFMRVTASFCVPWYLGKCPFRPAGSDPEVVCQKHSFLKVSVSLGGFGPSVAHGKHSVRWRCVQATKNEAETCSLLDAIGRRSCSRWRDWV